MRSRTGRLGHCSCCQIAFAGRLPERRPDIRGVVGDMQGSDPVSVSEFQHVDHAGVVPCVAPRRTGRAVPVSLNRIRRTEHLAAGHDAAPPPWAEFRVLRRPWFPAEWAVQRAEALVWAPAAFRKHRAYLPGRDLEAA